MTEKDYAPQKSESKKMIVEKPKKIPVANAPVDNKIINKVKSEDKVKSDVKGTIELEPIKQEEKKETLEPKGKDVEKEKPEEKKKPIVKNPIKKKTEAVVNAKSVPISTKHSMAICKFIRGKKINDCIEYLEQVIAKKKAMPMRGEIPHRKGKMMSGRFPKNASEHFIVLLRSLGANARENNLEDVVITEAIANLAARPRGKFGRTQKKRTHVTIKCREKQEKKSPKKNK
jgi:large subunit ribosomal protein L22